MTGNDKIVTVTWSASIFRVVKVTRNQLRLLILSVTCPLICSAPSWAPFPTMADNCVTCLASARRSRADTAEPALPPWCAVKRLSLLRIMLAIIGSAARKSTKVNEELPQTTGWAWGLSLVLLAALDKAAKTHDLQDLASRQTMMHQWWQGFCGGPDSALHSISFES